MIYTGQPILTASASGWDKDRLHRIALIVENQRVKVWYGARDFDANFYLGYTEAYVPSLAVDEETINIIGSSIQALKIGESVNR